MQIGSRARGGAHVEHVGHGCDAGGVEAQRLVERRRVLPRVERRACGAGRGIRVGGQQAVDDRGARSVQERARLQIGGRARGGAHQECGEGAGAGVGSGEGAGAGVGAGVGSSSTCGFGFAHRSRVEGESTIVSCSHLAFDANSVAVSAAPSMPAPLPLLSRSAGAQKGCCSRNSLLPQEGCSRNLLEPFALETNASKTARRCILWRRRCVVQPAGAPVTTENRCQLVYAAAGKFLPLTDRNVSDAGSNYVAEPCIAQWAANSHCLHPEASPRGSRPQNSNINWPFPLSD